MERIRCGLGVLAIALLIAALSVTAPKIAHAQTLELLSWQWEDPAYKPFWEESIKAFSEAHPNVSITKVHYPYETIFDKLNVLIAAESAPCILELTGFNVFQYAAMGALEPLDSYIARTDLPREMNNYNYATYNGKIYAVPLSSRTMQLLINRKLFDEAGIAPPTTMEEFFAAAKALTDPAKNQYGLVLVNTQGARLYEYVLVWTAGLGGHFAESGRPTLDSEATRKSVEFLKRLFDENVMPKGVRDAGSAWAYFLKGQAAMTIDGSWFFGTIKQQAPDLLPYVDALPNPTPTRAATGGVNNVIAISNTCPHKDLAWSYIEMISRPEWTQKWVTYTETLSPRKNSVPEDYYNDRPWFRTFAQEMAHTVQMAPPGLEEYFDQFVKVLTSKVEQVLYQNYPIDAALAEAQRQVERLITQ